MRHNTVEMCTGKWKEIFIRFGVDAKHLTGKHTPCPFCGGSDRFRFTDFEGKGFVICNQCMPNALGGITFLCRFTGMEFGELCKAIDDDYFGGVSTERASEIASEVATSKKKEAEKAEIRLAANRSKLNMMHSAFEPIKLGSATAIYLSSRGIDDYSQLKDLHHMESVEFYDAESQTLVQCSAMVGVIRDMLGKQATIHMTYLGFDGKKINYINNKKIHPKARDYMGGGIHLLGNDDSSIVVAEGIETALSAAKISQDCKVVATVSSGGMEKYIVPENCTRLAIYADNDESFTGLKAAYTLANRVWIERRIKITVHVPHTVGTDFNDVIIGGD